MQGLNEAKDCGMKCNSSLALVALSASPPGVNKLCVCVLARRLP